jgi:hypothetical protein
VEKLLHIYRWSWDVNIWEPDHVVVPACDWPGLEKTGFLPNAQHAMYALTDLFTPKWFREATFERLTEISLGSDFVTNFCEQEGTPLFSAMGRATPNLRVLDLSGLIRLRGESVLYLFFHDAFQSLHEYMYLHDHQFEVDESKGYSTIYLDHQVGPDRLRKHNFQRYCPWCVDHGTGNSLRAGCEFNPVVFSVIDPRLWDFVENGLSDFSSDLVRTCLMYAVSSAHLFRSVTAARQKLERPPGLRPFEEGFVPEPGGCSLLRE